MTNKNLNVKMPGGNPADRLVKEMASVSAQKEKKTISTKPVKKSAKASVFSMQEKEIKSVAMNLRVKESVRNEFEELRKMYGYSQSDFFEIMVKLARIESEKNK